ncbi:MAG: metallophosphoesterase family protein [Alphaproteobacteria bacterium]
MFMLDRKHRPRTLGMPSVAGRPARTAPGNRVYAIGDIHGRLDLLEALVEAIEADARRGDAGAQTLVLLGDYIDRGPCSAGVLDWIIDRRFEAIRLVALLGNHEASLLRFLSGDTSIGPSWLYYGGHATLESYGIHAARHEDRPAAIERLRAALRERLPARHLALLEALQPSHVNGDYLFVHAGVRPGVSLASQRREDLIWIRDEFLHSRRDHGKVIVHGHTIAPEPEICANRIGIDTGAFATDRLSCVVLEDASQRFLHT